MIKHSTFINFIILINNNSWTKAHNDHSGRKWNCKTIPPSHSRIFLCVSVKQSKTVDGKSFQADNVKKQSWKQILGFRSSYFSEKFSYSKVVDHSKFFINLLMIIKRWKDRNDLIMHKLDINCLYFPSHPYILPFFLDIQAVYHFVL